MTLCIQDLVSICLLVLKIWSKNQILTLINGRNSVANLQYMTHPNLDLVDGKVYTKFGFNLSMSICSHAIERESNCKKERERENDRIAPLFQSRAT